MRTKPTALKSRLCPGEVYRRQDLVPYSRNLNRELQGLLQSGLLKKAAYGVYYCPAQSRFGELPPDYHALIQAFLKTDDFLAFSPILLNDLGLGSTQLSMAIRVYNHKRHGMFKLGGRVFDFRRRLNFPRALSAEFLFVEFLNEHMAMAEEVVLKPQRLRAKIKQFDQALLEQLIKQFGKVFTQKIYAALTTPQSTLPTRSRRAVKSVHADQ